jgi:hypothetical protein
VKTKVYSTCKVMICNEYFSREGNVIKLKEKFMLTSLELLLYVEFLSLKRYRANIMQYFMVENYLHHFI